LDKSVKIKIIRGDIKERLGKYLSYRHFIRHSYSSELRWNEMAPLVKGLDETWKAVKTDFEVFINKS